MLQYAKQFYNIKAPKHNWSFDQNFARKDFLHCHTVLNLHCQATVIKIH